MVNSLSPQTLSHCYSRRVIEGGSRRLFEKIITANTILGQRRCTPTIVFGTFHPSIKNVIRPSSSSISNIVVTVTPCDDDDLRSKDPPRILTRFRSEEEVSLGHSSKPVDQRHHPACLKPTSLCWPIKTRGVGIIVYDQVEAIPQGRKPTPIVLQWEM